MTDCIMVNELRRIILAKNDSSVPNTVVWRSILMFAHEIVYIFLFAK